MKTSEKLDQLIPALLKVQSDLPKVMDKDSKGMYEYTSLDNLLIKVKPILEKHKLVIIQLPVGDDIMIGVETLLCHESGQYISNRMQTNIESSKRINLYQSAGTAITYYRRYSIMALLNLASGEDTDGVLEQELAPKKQPQKQFTPQPKIVSNGTVKYNNTDLMGDAY